MAFFIFILIFTLNSGDGAAAAGGMAGDEATGAGAQGAPSRMFCCFILRYLRPVMKPLVLVLRCSELCVAFFIFIFILKLI